jgi:hypothetical protein
MLTSFGATIFSSVPATTFPPFHSFFSFSLQRSSVLIESIWPERFLDPYLNLFHVLQAHQTGGVARWTVSRGPYGTDLQLVELFN